MTASRDRTDRLRRYWDNKSGGYDREMRFWERRLFGDSRQWACSRATGEVLEVAVGTGLNLAHYPDDVTLTGIDFSEQMLAIARDRAIDLGRKADLRQGDAHELPFDDAAFDTVVCTFGLCVIPDLDLAIREMIRVLRPGGQLILVDHIASSSRVLRGVQWAIERLTLPLGGEHMRRRPLQTLRQTGLEITDRERFKAGLIERIVARKSTA